MRNAFVVTMGVAIMASCDGPTCSKKADAPGPAQTAAAAATPTDDAFWGWFKASEAELADAVLGNPEAALKDINDALRKVRPTLGAEMAIDRKGGKHTVVFTALGKIDEFASVRSLVATAPPLTRFNVLAFRPRRPADTEIEVEGETYKTSDFMFREAGRKEGKLDLELYVRGLTEANHEKKMTTAMLLLDGTLGELDAATKIGDVSIGELPDTASATGLKLQPLSALPNAVDGL